MTRLAIIIPALNAASSLGATLDQIASAQAVVAEPVLVDGGSGDGTVSLAMERGIRVVASDKGRGVQMAAGAAASEAPWLFFLHADTLLEDGWDHEIAAFLADAANVEKAGVFRLCFDDDARAARRLEWIANRRSRWLGLPYGDQGLVLSRAFYEAIGGFEPIPIMEDVSIVRRIGKARLVTFERSAVTSAKRYRHGGYTARMLRNLVCLMSYFLGVSPNRLAKLYG